MGRRSRRGVPTSSVVVSVVLALLLLAGIVLVVAGDGEGEAAAPTRSASPSREPSPSSLPDPPNLPVERTERRLRGFPEDWYQLEAEDGSFRIVVREPTSIRDLADGGWEFEISGGGPSMYFHGRDLGSVPTRATARALAKDQIERWTRDLDGASRPVTVTSGGERPVRGWEIRVPFPHRIDTYRMFAAHRWMVGIWASAGRKDAEGARLAARFLDSFEVLPSSGDEDDDGGSLSL